MLKKATFFGTLIGVGFLLGALSGAIASEATPKSVNQHTISQTNQFQAIDQPLQNKVVVTLGGLGLIGLDLWWFLFSKPKARKPTIEKRSERM